MAYSTNQVNKFVFIPLQSSEGMETYVDLSTVTKASFAHMSCICPFTLGAIIPNNGGEEFDLERPFILSLHTPNKESKIPYQISVDIKALLGGDILSGLKESRRINKLLKPFNMGFLCGVLGEAMMLFLFDPAVEVYCNQGVIEKFTTYGEGWEDFLAEISAMEQVEIAEGVTLSDFGFSNKIMESFNLKRISAFANFADGFSNDQMFGVGYPYTDFPAKLSNIDEIHINIPMEDWPSYVAFALECDYQGTGEDTQKSHMIYQGFMPGELMETLYWELMSKNIPITLTGLGNPSGPQ